METVKHSLSDYKSGDRIILTLNTYSLLGKWKNGLDCPIARATQKMFPKGEVHVVPCAVYIFEPGNDLGSGRRLSIEGGFSLFDCIKAKFKGFFHKILPFIPQPEVHLTFSN